VAARCILYNDKDGDDKIDFDEFSNLVQSRGLVSGWRSSKGFGISIPWGQPFSGWHHGETCHQLAELLAREREGSPMKASTLLSH